MSLAVRSPGRFLLLIVLCAFAPVFMATGQQPALTTAERRLIGSYEYDSGGESIYDVYISFGVWREGDKIILGYQGSHPKGAGAAPEGRGSGSIGRDGVFRFEYEDSFFNRGKGTLRRRRGRYRLSIEIEHMEDPRCAMFYGNFSVRRVSASPRNI